MLWAEYIKQGQGERIKRIRDFNKQLTRQLKSKGSYLQVRNEYIFEDSTAANFGFYCKQVCPSSSNSEFRKASAGHEQQRMNSYLKELVDLCKKFKGTYLSLCQAYISYHSGMANGVSSETVIKMLDHKSLKTTQH